MNRSKTPTEAQKLVQKLLKRGMREIDIAAEVDVHFNSVLRWRDGKTAPHGSHLRKLQELATSK